MELFNFSFFSVTGWGIDLDYCDIEWFALETNTWTASWDIYMQVRKQQLELDMEQQIGSK